MVVGDLQTTKPKFHCDNTTIPVSEDLTLLGVNERTLRFLLKDKSSSYTELVKKLGFVSLYDQRIKKTASCVFKVLNNDIPQP